MFDRYTYWNNAALLAASGGVATPVARLDTAASGNASTLAYAVSAGTDRCLLIGVTQEANPTSDCTVDYGGQAATQIASVAANVGGVQCRAQLFRVMEAGIAAASGSTITATGLTGVYTIHAASYENVHQSSPVSGSDTDFSDASTPNPLAACDITVPSDGLGVAIAAVGDGPVTATWANLTEQTEQQNGSHEGSFADTLTPGATSVDCTWSTQTRAAIIGAALSPALSGSGGGYEEPPAADPFATVMAAKAPSAWWRAGEASGNLADASGSGLTLTAAGSITYGTAGMTTDGDDAITLDGSSAYGSASDNAAFDFGAGDFTLMAAVKLSAWPSTTHGFIMAHNGGGATGDWGWFLNRFSTNRVTLYLDGANYNVTSPVTLADGAWHLLIMAADRSGNALLYVDDNAPVAVDISAQVAADLTNALDFYLGRRNAGDYLAGSLDEPAIWKGTLLDSTDVHEIHGAL